MILREFSTTKKRREHLEKILQVNLKKVEQVHIEDEENIHCENLIGATTLPLGVAGPINVKTQNSKLKSYYIPLATTEGALVASVNRGCKAITDSGGATVNSYKIGATRGPVFDTGSISEGEKFYQWLLRNKKQLTEIAETSSSHLKLTKYDIKSLANYTYIRFYFDTQEAMGMNMATIATQKMVNWIEKETNIKCLTLAGNFDVDKKPAWLNFINNRGYEVWAEIIINKKIVKTILKTTSKKFFEVWLAKCMIGSAISGSLGFNAHYANIVAAIFAATGQDLAHVVEGSMGITTVKVLEEEDLYVSVYLPALMIGLVGGGTKLKIKQEALSIIGAKNSSELAEVLAATVLAGELSLLASLAEGSLAKVHERLGR